MVPVGDDYQVEIPPFTECGGASDKMAVCRNQDFSVPELRCENWSENEKDVFHLGLYIFGKKFIRVQKFLESKSTVDILSFYYTKFYRSQEHRTYKEFRKMRTRREGVKKIFLGLKVQELLSRLRLIISEDYHPHLVEVSKAFRVTNMSLKECIVTLNAMFGINTLVNAACLGIVSPTNPQIVDNKYSSLKFVEIINILRGDQRLTKDSSNRLFWGAIWPRLENKGWHSEQSKNRGYTANSKIFLMPRYKFSEGLVKGLHYFDSVFELLSKVAEEPDLLGIEDHHNSALVVDASISDGKLNQVRESRGSPKSDSEMLQGNRETYASVDPNLIQEIGSEQRQLVEQQSSTSLHRRQSTRNRQPTTRVLDRLDAWASGFLTVKSGQKRKCQEKCIRQPDEQLASTNVVQRHSTRSRQPTSRALGAFANGYITVNSRQKKKSHQATRGAAIE